MAAVGGRRRRFYWVESTEFYRIFSIFRGARTLDLSIIATRLLAKIGSTPGFKTAAFRTKGIFFLMSTTKDIMSIGTAAKNIIPQVLSRLGPEENFIQLSLVSLLLQHFANKSQKNANLIETPNIANRYHGNIPNWHIFLHIISCLHSEPFLENRANLHRPTWVKRTTRAGTT